MPHAIRRLHNVMIRGLHGGLRWETKGTRTVDESGQVVHVYYDLLHNPYSNHLGRVITRQLGTSTKTLVAEALADLFELAASYVRLCQYTDPKEFFKFVKDSFAWSSKISDDAFWGLTQRLFHARALFKDTIPDAPISRGTKLTIALDNFLTQFNQFYVHDDIKPELGQTGWGKTFRDRELERKKACAMKYSELSYSDSEGDGSDLKKCSPIIDGKDLVLDLYRPRKKHEAQEPENKNYWAELGGKNPRLAKVDLFSELERRFSALDISDSMDSSYYSFVSHSLHTTTVSFKQYTCRRITKEDKFTMYWHVQDQPDDEADLTES
ncbi:hypothetical protein GGR57DRAFT_514078 [Xylariaceae sp. FL1272]|nr:hypothetical protein GGR57DRAFT_514078 [Xylariaceae sp. FL1272]